MTRTRPNINDYMMLSDDDRLNQHIPVAYVMDLEAYVNELEKALDKACTLLKEGYGNEYADYEYAQDWDTIIIIPTDMTAEEWKEWCMKDE